MSGQHGRGDSCGVAVEMQRVFVSRSLFPSSLAETRLARIYASSQTRRICAAAGQGGGGTVEPPDVRKLAKLAQINVTDEEVLEWEPKLKEIVGWFDQLREIDVEGVPPCTRSSMADLLAAGKDEPAEYKNREELLRAVPDREGPYVRVPKIL